MIGNEDESVQDEFDEYSLDEDNHCDESTR